MMMIMLMVMVIIKMMMIMLMVIIKMIMMMMTTSLVKGYITSRLHFTDAFDRTFPTQNLFLRGHFRPHTRKETHIQTDRARNILLMKTFLIERFTFFKI